jgi:hypothetical protein
VEASLGEEGDEDDEGADGRDDPRRRELQRRLLPDGLRHGFSLCGGARWWEIGSVRNRGSDATRDLLLQQVAYYS